MKKNKSSVIILCDGCQAQWRGLPPEWHNKKCKKCGYSPVISDKDMSVWEASERLKELGIAFDINDPRLKDKEGFVSVRIDTRPLNGNHNSD